MQENIIKKIKALFSKTLENGATIEESKSAFEMASKLMTKHNIKMAELDAKPQYDILSLSTKKTVNNVNLSIFGNSIAKLFDCTLTFNHFEVFFFGHREDVELAIFSFETLTEKCEKELKKYKKTENYINIIEMDKGLGKTLCNSFRKGFYLEIANKLRAIYEQRKEEINNSNKYALVLRSKIEQVKEEFAKRNPNVGMRKASTDIRVDRSAFNHGIAVGRKTVIQQGIK